jgi:hypothetical protein
MTFHLISLSSDRYQQQYAGQMALQAGVLVAFTQIIPEHQLQLFGSFKIRVKVRHPTTWKPDCGADGK